MITLLPIVSLFVFGGSTLRDFAFAIIVGIAVGAVSTIFIATPLLSSLLERDPEFRGRRGGVSTDRKLRGVLVQQAELAAAAMPTPVTPMDEVEHVIDSVGETVAAEEAKRARRRQRRQARPHGRPR